MNFCVLSPLPTLGVYLSAVGHQYWYQNHYRHEDVCVYFMMPYRPVIKLPPGTGSSGCVVATDRV